MMPPISHPRGFFFKRNIFCTTLYGIRQEKKGKTDCKDVMEYCSKKIKPIFRFMKMSFDIEIPPSVDVKQSYVIIVNHQHALDAYLFNQVKTLGY